MFRLPTNTVIRPGAITELGNVVSALGASRVFLVSDEGLGNTPWPAVVEEVLSSLGTARAIFTDVAPNPRTFQVDQAARAAQSFEADLVLGLGGGSVLDTAKAVAMLCRNEGSIRDFEGKEVFANQPLPFVAIPTTCGTGSEVTWVSVVSDPDSKRKMSVKGTGMFPTYALVDSNLIKTLPSSLIAYTGMDALTHAMEALVSKCANPVSDALAVAAIQLISEHIEDCVNDRSDSNHREALMRGSTLAGISFGNADVGAVHCLSESIGGLFDHPHGLLNAQLLLPVMQFQYADIHRKLETVSEFRNPESLLARIEQLVDSLGIPALATLNIPEESWPKIAQMAEQNNSNASNPRDMVARDYEQILESMMQ